MMPLFALSQMNLGAPLKVKILAKFFVTESLDLSGIENPQLNCEYSSTAVSKNLCLLSELAMGPTIERERELLKRLGSPNQMGRIILKIFRLYFVTHQTRITKFFHISKFKG